MRACRFHLGSDHGGVELRDELAAVLTADGHTIMSTAGPRSADESADYPDIAVTVCRRLLEDPGSFGLLVCGTGQGMAMTANRIPGIRAALVGDVFSARMARAHNDANVLCLGQRVLGSELAKALAREFAATSFEGGRHQR
ncbi:MAG: ribose 5-phosphate isomerase B, partial [Myxococcales bacterium]|nr:ribose 5-phosphate isomerase B [Myxococcales bacterium]